MKKKVLERIIRSLNELEGKYLLKCWDQYFYVSGNSKYYGNFDLDKVKIYNSEEEAKKDMEDFIFQLNISNVWYDYEIKEADLDVISIDTLLYRVLESSYEKYLQKFMKKCCNLKCPEDVKLCRKVLKILN